MNCSIRQMGLGTCSRLQKKHERLWAREVIEVRYLLLVMNKIGASDVTNPENVIKFHGIVVHRLLTEDDVDEMRFRGSSDRAPFVPGGTPSGS